MSARGGGWGVGVEGPEQRSPLALQQDLDFIGIGF